MKKYVIIPEFKPLYALARRFGPQTGPIRKPIPVDVDVIKDLLNQKPPVKVLEAHMTNVKLGLYSETVELTMTNYNTENFKIDKRASVEVKVEKPSTTQETIPEPTVSVTVNADTVDVAITDDQIAAIVADANSVAETAKKPMTKAERKAAARAAREAEASANRQSDTVTVAIES